MQECCPPGLSAGPSPALRGGEAGHQSRVPPLLVRNDPQSCVPLKDAHRVSLEHVQRQRAWLEQEPLDGHSHPHSSPGGQIHPLQAGSVSPAPAPQPYQDHTRPCSTPHDPNSHNPPFLP